LYDRGEIPSELGEDERKLLRGAVEDIAREFDGMEEEYEGFVDAAYEGRRGASPREIMSLLTEIAVERTGDTLTPVDVFEALPRLTKDATLYSWLRVKGARGFQEPDQLVDMVRREYLKHIATEVQKATDLVDEKEYQRLFLAYIHNVRAFETREKVTNIATGRLEDPDQNLMINVEDRIGVRGSREAFRQDIMNKIGAFRLTHPDRPLVLMELFRDHTLSLERSFFKERRARIVTMVEDALSIDSGGADRMVIERRVAATSLVERLVSEFGYNQSSVQQVLAYFRAHHRELPD
jgi:predicted Ser/Thr protein kinase